MMAPPAAELAGALAAEDQPESNTDCNGLSNNHPPRIEMDKFRHATEQCCRHAWITHARESAYDM